MNPDSALTTHLQAPIHAQVMRQDPPSSKQTTSSPKTTQPVGTPLPKPGQWFRESIKRERTLTIFGLILAVLIIPALIAMGLDDRTLRGVNVWIKPVKFLAATSLMSLTTAWFIGLLTQDGRKRWPIRASVWVLVIIGTAEIAFIALQAARGEASHYNYSSAVYAAIYSLMGLGALALTATQAVLAVAIARHGRNDVDPIWKTAVVWGLFLTFLLGAGAGGLLGSVQPPSGSGIPFFGWHLGGGDLRPAHFVGMHAAQIIPLAGFLLAGTAALRQARMKLVGFTTAYSLVWLAAMIMGIHGATFTPPKLPI